MYLLHRSAVLRRVRNTALNMVERNTADPTTCEMTSQETGPSIHVAQPKGAPQHWERENWDVGRHLPWRAHAVRDTMSGLAWVSFA